MITPRLLNLQDLFGDRVQYQVPIYQRPYVWSQEDQWEPLWEDIQEVAARHLRGQAGPSAHFLGAIVIELTSAEPGRARTYSVIDGQQRLTTLQLVLSALRCVLNGRDPERLGDVNRLLRNDGRHTDGDLRFKLSLGEHDRPAFRAALDAAYATPGDATDGIPGALAFFHSRIAEWLDADGGAGAVPRLDALQDALDGLLQVVAIQLDGSSDAQVIFETLNSRGADLTSLDLAKNALLQQARREGDNDADLHARYWQPALGDADYWLETIRQGRYTSERADLFLMHWLTMRTGKVPHVQRLFGDFRKEILRSEQPPRASAVLADLSRSADIYRSFDLLDPSSVEGKFFRRLDQMDTTTLLPVALLLFQADELTANRRRRALRALESWLVRRMILGATTQHYNRLLTALLADLNRRPNFADADDHIVAALRGFANPTDTWPTDDAVRTRLTQQPVYGVINQKRVRILLEACEERMADTNRTEQIAVPTGLTIEHALPQNWRAHWAPRASDDPEAFALERDAHVHRLGNLTLITHALNAALSDSIWTVKKAELARRSQLLVNQRLCAHEEWDERLIDERSAELAEYIVISWPGPTADW